MGTQYVTSVLKDWSGSRRGPSMAVDRYTVVFDTPGHCNLEDAIIADDDVQAIPAFGSKHPDNDYLLSKTPTARKMSPTMCEVVVNYEGWTSPAGEEDPEAFETQYSWTSAASIEAIDEDVDGDAIINVNDEAFDPPPTKEHMDPVCTIVHQIPYASWKVSDKTDYENTVNSHETVLDGATLSVGEGRITGFDVETIVVGDEKFVRQTITVQIRRTINNAAWELRILNQGFRDDAGDEFVDADGNPRAQPTLLKADGTEATKATATWLEFDIYEESNWNNLDAFNAPGA